MSEALREKYEIQSGLNPELASRDDTTTWLAEILDGSMHSEFSYQYDGSDLVARDGRPLEPIFVDAIKQAENEVISRPEKAFELRRRKVELKEYEEILAMAKSESPNTMVVVSDFPKELEYADKDLDGYNVTRKQAMLRVITREADGEIKMVSQSLDRSDRRGLEAIYRFLNFEPKAGELLGQRISLDIDQPFQTKLTDTLTTVYDNHMSDYYGGEWYAGRKSDDRRNTYAFAREQHDLIGAYMVSTQDEKAKYNLAATIESRFKKQAWYDEKLPTIDCPSSYISVAVEMEIQGRRARAEGKTFSGCGSSITMSSEEEMSNLGYDEKSDKTKDDEPMKCVNCPECKTFHHEVRKVKGKYVCDNDKCKLSDKKSS